MGCKQAFPQARCICSLSCCLYKTLAKCDLGMKGFVWLICPDQSIIGEVRAEAGTMEESIFLSCSACYLILSRAVCPGVGGTGHRGLGPLLSIIYQEIDPQTCPQANMMETIPFSQICSRSVSSGQKLASMPLPPEPYPQHAHYLECADRLRDPRDAGQLGLL